MAYQRYPQTATERRCTNCGTRVARDAETCFMCNHDLRIKPRRRQRISWIDSLLVLAVIGVLVFWWQAGRQTEQDQIVESEAQPILPENIPVLSPTSTPTVTPVPTETPTAPPPEEVSLTHEVRPGETLLGIAGFYGVTVEQVKRANNRVDELIRVGEVLKIPVTRPSDVGSETRTAQASLSYQVQERDTVVSISVLTGSPVEEILAANNLGANAIIRPGDVLVIPVQVPDEVIENAASDENAAAPTEVPADDNTSRIYIQPSLTGPPDGATFSREESILLRWASVSILEPDEWYVIQITPESGATSEILPEWQKTTSHRLPASLAPPAGESATYSWQVSVIRVTTGPDGTRRLTATSPPSDTRFFTWQ